MVMASAVSLPLQQLMLCSPLMFAYKESFFWGDGVALVLVLLGFCVYQMSREGRASRGKTKFIDDSSGGDEGNKNSTQQRRGPTLSERRRKKAELEAAREDLRVRRQSLRSGGSFSGVVSKAKIRSLLRCDQCEHLESGVCNTCRALFSSDQWVSMHPDWRKRQEEEALQDQVQYDQ